MKHYYCTNMVWFQDVVAELDKRGEKGLALQLTTCPFDESEDVSLTDGIISRSKMPQIQSDLVPLFLEQLKERGIRIKQGKEQASDLKPTQREINVKKAKQMMGKGKSLAKPVIVSKNRYLLDGHHRWAALCLLDDNTKIPVIQVDLPIKKLLNEAYKFDEVDYKDID